MSLHLSESEIALLADPQGTDPRVRLGQALARGRFLLHASQTVAALQHPRRALEALTELLLGDLVDVAQVCVRTRTAVLTCSGIAGGPLRSTSSPPEHEAPGLMESMAGGRRQDLLLPRPTGQRRASLRDLLAHDDVAARVARSDVEHLVVLPLVARGGPFGLLALGRTQGQDFAGCDDFLEDLADRIAVGMEAILVVAESRRVAAVLRQSLSPLSVRDVPHLRIATYSREAEQSQHLSGDFVDVFGPDHDLHILCGDVEGKGVEAAVDAQRIRTTVRAATLVEPDPAFVLDLANRVLLSESRGQPERLVTAICVRIQSETGRCRVTVSNAGHPPALLVRDDGVVEELQSEGASLGLDEHAVYGSATAELGPLDTLLLHTDGVTEARGVRDLFGEERLHRLLSHLGGAPSPALVEAVAVAVSEHAADRPKDDIAMLAVQRRAERP